MSLRRGRLSKRMDAKYAIRPTPKDARCSGILKVDGIGKELVLRYRLTFDLTALTASRAMTCVSDMRKKCTRTGNESV